ncbi:MAG: FHA domain-containing protein [Chitinophagaceae bacterium]|nr:FHA domain-containing protein [Anaerolineae bacterium]
MSYIVMRRGPEPGKVYRLETEQVKIGRGSKNDIIIHDNDVFREHLLLVHTSEGYELTDLTDTKTTSVNGQMVDGVWLLQSNCIIEMGDAITMEYRLGEPQEEIVTSEMMSAAVAAIAPSQAYLIISLSSHPDASVYPLEGMVMKVGRGQTNDIVIVEPEMSREHFRLTLTGQGYIIEDLGSTNGTMVNGDMLMEGVLLKPGDTISIGTMVQIQYSGSPDRVATKLKTDQLPSLAETRALDPTPKRKTSPDDIPEAMIEKPTRPVGIMKTGIEPVSMRDKVLVTYARDDWDSIVAPLLVSLKDAEIEVWVDQNLVIGGAEWYTFTEQARLECWALVVVVSPAAMRAELVRKNWRHFQNREKPIVLVIHELVEHMPIGSQKLSRIQYNPGLPEMAYKQLIAELKRQKP